MAAISTLAILGSLAFGVQQSIQARKDAKKAAKEQKEILAEAKPDAPVGVGQEGTTGRRKAIKAGRGGGILTGNLAPANVGKKRLLGGA